MNGRFMAHLGRTLESAKDQTYCLSGFDEDDISILSMTKALFKSDSSDLTYDNGGGIPTYIKCRFGNSRRSLAGVLAKKSAALLPFIPMCACTQ